ncbi:hypothetical protein Tco_0134480 [Tanacetum coccineum]
MNPTAQQIALDNALVASENRVTIGKYNTRIDPIKTLKEPTYQVVLDALALSPLYPAFLIIAEIICTNLGEPFAAVINKCLPRKTTGLNKIKLSRAQILWGMYYNQNVDFVELLWEDFMFQIDNRDSKKQEKMYYPGFTKAIIQHFISKDKSISMRNILFMHTVQNDSILGPLRFVSKTKEYQVYGALIPVEMTNKKMQNSTTYKTYLAFATGETTPKKARKFKKPASLSKKNTLVTVDEPIEKPAKKHGARRQSAGVQI